MYVNIVSDMFGMCMRESVFVDVSVFGVCRQQVCVVMVWSMLMVHACVVMMLCTLLAMIGECMFAKLECLSQ